MAEVGAQGRKQSIDVTPLCVPRLDTADGERVAKVVRSWPGFGDLSHPACAVDGRPHRRVGQTPSQARNEEGSRRLCAYRPKRMVDVATQRLHLALRRGLENPINKSERLQETKQKAAALIKQYIQSKIEINKFWELLGDDYFIRYSPDEIAWHTSSIVNKKNLNLPLIQVKEKTSRGGTEIFIYMQDQDYIFAITTKALDQLGLNIVDARIITSSDEYTLDSYTVLEEDGNIINGKHRKNEITETLQHELSSLSTLPQDKWQRRIRKLQHFSHPTTVSFTPDEKNNRTIMEVTAADRPGFLSRIGTAMVFCGTRLQSAKIATYGARVEDIFFITDKKNNMITDEIKFECLRNSIVDTLSNQK